jgi:hypothetical protein
MSRDVNLRFDYVKLTGSITAPEVGSIGAPACTAKVPNLWTGLGALGGVSIFGSSKVGILFRVARPFQRL